MSGLSLSLGLGLTSLRPSGGTPTPTPTSATLIYDATAKQFVVTNAASFPGALWAWKDELGNVIAGQIGSTLARAAAPDGLSVQAIPDGIAASASNFAIAPVILADFTDEFSGVNGTILSGYNGWQAWTNWQDAARPAPGANILALQDGDLYQSASVDGSTWWRHSASAVEKRVDLIGFRNPLGATNNQKTERAIYMDTSWAAGKKSEISLSLTQASGLNLSKNVAGTNTTLLDLSNSTIGKNDVALARINGRAHVFVDGVELAQSIAAGGWDVSDVPVSGYVGLGGFGGTAPTQPYKILDRFVVTKSLDKAFSVTSVVTSAPDATYPSGKITITGTCTSGITNYDWSVSRPNGAQVLDWTSNVAVNSDGNWSIVRALPVEIAGSTDLIFNVRPSSDKAKLTSQALGPIGAYQTIFPYRRGVNEGYISDWSTAGRERNLFAFVPSRLIGTGPWEYMTNFSDAETGLTPDGQYHSYPIDAGTSLPYTKVGFSLPLSARGKTLDLAYPATMTASLQSLTDVTILQAPSGGTVKIAVGANGGGLLQLAGAIPSAGVGPANVTAFIAGETDKTSYLSDEFQTGMAAWAAGGQRLLYRNMTADGINNQSKAVTVVNTGGQSTGPLSPKAWGEISRMNGVTDVYTNMGHLNPDSYIADFAAALNPAINPASLVYPEMSNEVGWNDKFSQHRWFYYEGAKAGYHVSGTVPAPIPGLLDFIDQSSKINRVTGVLGVAVAAGTYIAYAREGVGWLVAQAKSDRAIGDTVPTATNANWTIIADQPAMSRAMKRQYATRSAALFDIFDAEFGAGRVVPVVAYQQGGIQTDILEWNDLYLKLAGRGRYAVAPYWGDTLGNWGTYTTGWGATEQGLINTDVPAFKTAFFNAAAIVIQAKLDATVASKNALAVWCVSKGLSPDAIQFASYECNWHTIFGGGWPASINTIYGEIIRDPRMGTLMAQYATGLATRVGGDHVWFDRIGKIPTSPTLQSWAITENEADITSSNARFTALLGVA